MRSGTWSCFFVPQAPKASVKERHWNSLVASLRHAQCVLMLGPDIPIGAPSSDPRAGPDTSFGAALRRELARELEDDGRRVVGTTLAAIAQQYEDTDGFGPGALRATAERFLRAGLYGPSPVHAKLASLPISLVVTTCHDDLLIEALRGLGKAPIAQRYNIRGDRRDNPEFMLPNTPQSPVVFHLFGDGAEPSSLVLSENDILDFLIAFVSERPPVPNSLLRALKRAGQSFLFVGFGIRQWALRLLLKLLLRALDVSRGGTAIAAESLRGLLEADREDIILFYQRGTRVEVEDADVEAFVTELCQRFEKEGGLDGNPAPVGPRPHVFISYAREDADLASRVFDALQKANFEPWLDQESLSGGEDWYQRIESELDSTDFTLVLYTPAFCRKTDNYVNSELALARRRALRVRGPFIIPIRTDNVTDADRVDELREYNEMKLRLAVFDQDIAKVVSTISREYQRRNR